MGDGRHDRAWEIAFKIEIRARDLHGHKARTYENGVRRHLAWIFRTRSGRTLFSGLIGDSVRAEQVVQDSLARTPNNGWALYGLLEACRARGDADDVAELRVQLDRAWTGDRALLNLSRL